MSSSRGSHRPGAVLGAAALVGAVGVTVLVAPLSMPALAAGVLGVACLAAGLTRHTKWLTTGGVLGVTGAVVAAALAGSAVWRLLGAIAGATLAWEFALGAFAAAAELAGGAVERAELRHVAVTTLAVAGVAAIAFVVVRTMTVGVSLPGATLLVVAATALALGLRG